MEHYTVFHSYCSSDEAVELKHAYVACMWCRMQLYWLPESSANALCGTRIADEQQRRFLFNISIENSTFDACIGRRKHLILACARREFYGNFYHTCVVIWFPTGTMGIFTTLVYVFTMLYGNYYRHFQSIIFKGTNGNRYDLKILKLSFRTI